MPIDEAPTSSSIRVGTWNVEYARGAEKNRRRLAVLSERNADIWVLTETHDELEPPPDYHSVSTERRYSAGNGGRWTTIWSRFPIVESIETLDPSRTVCVRVTTDGGPGIVVYGTVLPWHTDGAADEPPKKNWSEFHRVVEVQAAEWRCLRQSYPDDALIVAGDLNHNLGGKHYYGTKDGRVRLREALASADLTCLTETDRIPNGQLAYPPIDHVCAAAPAGRHLDSRAEGWEKIDADGVALTDHSGVAATITFSWLRHATGC